MPRTTIGSPSMTPTMVLTPGTSLSVRGTTAPIDRRIRCSFGLLSPTVGFVVVLLCWQIALLLALLWEFVEPGRYAGIHFVGCLGLTAWLCRRSNAAVGDSAALQIVAWSAFAGPFGVFVAAALVLRPAAIHSEDRSGSGAESLTVDRDDSKRIEDVHLALLDRRVRLECASHISPLMDVLAEGSQSEKLEALGVLYRKFDADLGPVLKRALQDPDAPVRVLAATVAAKLHATFSHTIGDRQAAADAAPKLTQNWQRIADARLAYAESGLLEAPRARTEI